MITELTEDPQVALKGKAAAVVVFYAEWCGDSKKNTRKSWMRSSEAGWSSSVSMRWDWRR